MVIKHVDNIEDLIKLYEKLTYQDPDSPEQNDDVSDTPEEIEATGMHDDNVDADGYMTPSHPDFNYNDYIVDLINQVLVKTLTTKETVSLETARTLTTLVDIQNSILVRPSGK